MTREAKLGLVLATLASSCAGGGSSIGRDHFASETPEVVPARGAADAAPPSELRPVAPSELRVTSGSIIPISATEFEINSPVLRAELGQMPRSSAELSFTYRGPSQDEEPLTSGELRRQVGLKVRAQDTCNVLYVMWHIEPSAGLHVSVKSNPGQSLHSECGDRGYIFLDAAASRPVSAIGIGEQHVLRASIVGEELRVLADGVESWVGRLPAEAFRFDGPIGLRSDNGELTVELRADPSDAPGETP